MSRKMTGQPEQGARLCNECAATKEVPVGKAVLTVRAGNFTAGLCLAHAIQLALDIRRAVRKDLPQALTH